MNILIATDGVLPIAETVARTERLYREGDNVSVMTAINLPGHLIAALKRMSRGNTGSLEEIVDAAGPAHLGLAGGDRIAQQLASQEAAWPVDDYLKEYFAHVATQCTQPMADALAEIGIQAKTVVRETEERTAQTIIDACEDLEVDVLVIGATGRGRFEGLVGSTGTKLMRHAPCDVFLIRLEEETKT